MLFRSAGFEAYPNPTNDVLNLKNSQNIDTVSLFDLIGKNILSQTINATYSQVDISSLQNGIYLMKILSDQKEKTIKIIKK